MWTLISQKMPQAMDLSELVSKLPKATVQKEAKIGMIAQPHVSLTSDDICF